MSHRVTGLGRTKTKPVARRPGLGGDQRGRPTILKYLAVRHYLKQILVDGFFHADPHPGNVFLTDDHRIALLDLGMVGHITPLLQENLLQLLLAVSDGRGDDAATIAIKISELKEEFSENTFRQRVASLVSELQGSEMEQLQVGRVVLEITQISGDNGLRVPLNKWLQARPGFAWLFVLAHKGAARRRLKRLVRQCFSFPSHPHTLAFIASSPDHRQC